MAVFQTLGELNNYLEKTPEVRVVDAGIPLVHYAAGNADYGPAWESQPSVRKVVGFIARNLASIPLHVYDLVDDNDRRRVRDGRLAAVIKRPSRAPAMTPYRVWESVLIDGLLTDRWCMLKVRLSDGGLELVRIPAYRTKFNADGLGRIDSVSIWVEGREQKFDPAKFVLDYGYSQRGAGGTSPLVTMRHLLDEAREAVQYRRDLWKRGARVPAVVERKTSWPPDGKARDRFISALQAFQAGGGREGSTLVLEDDMHYKEAPSFNPQEVADLEGRKLTDIEVCSSYYVAPELLGIRQGNYSNVDAYRQMLWQISLGPYVTAWEQAVNAQLVPDLAPNTDQYVEAHLDSKLRGSFEEQAKYLQTMVGAPILVRNEGRARLNLPAIEGGDELITPLNVLIGGQASPTDSGTQNEKSDPAHVKTALERFFRRQRTTVLSRAAAGGDWWQGERWDAELAADLQKALMSTFPHTGDEAVALALLTISHQVAKATNQVTRAQLGDAPTAAAVAATFDWRDAGVGDLADALLVAV